MCCQCCPEPQNEEDKQLQQKEDEHNIRGRIVYVMLPSLKMTRIVFDGP